MATVTINNAFKDFITFDLEVTGTDAKQFGLVSNQIQDYRISINGGLPVTVIGSNLTVYLPYQANFVGEVLNVEIEAIKGSIAAITGLVVTDSQTGTIFNTTQFNKLPNLESLQLAGTNRKTNLNGNISDLPSTLTYFQAGGNISGTISELPSGLTWFSFFNSDANQAGNITGSLSDLPTGLTHLIMTDNTGSVVFTGSTSDLPSTLIYINSALFGTIDFDVDNLPANIENVSLLSYGGASMDVSGDIANIPSTCTVFYVGNSNTTSLSGDISNLPALMTEFNITGLGVDTNTISGNIQTLSAAMRYFRVNGSNTIAGDIGLTNFPNGSTVLIDGNNTISGNIDAITANFVNFQIDGNNTIAGDLGTFLENNFTSTLYILGNNTISAFTTPVSSELDTGGTFDMQIDGANDLTTAEVDNLLIFFDSISLIGTNRTISILGSSQSRSATSDTAYNSLIAKGFNITLN